MKRLITLVSALIVSLSLNAQTPAQTQSADLVVFGATPAGIMASIAAARKGEKVILLEPSYIVGGMMSGGLTKTDIGNRSTVGGLSFEFFARVHDYYVKKYGADSEQAKATNKGLFFEPHVADLIFSRLLEESGVKVLRKQHLIETKVSGNKRISSILTRHYETGEIIETKGDFFIDSTYEGDLMAGARVPYRVGREAVAEYDESLAGITAGPEQYIGKGDHRVQAYNFRSTITNRADVLRPFPKPKYYQPERHRHYIDYVKKHNIKTFEELFHDAPLWGPVNGKSDPNKADLPGANYAYAEGDYEMRAIIAQKVSDYWLSMWYMLATDPELSDEFKASVRKWGLPTDEFVESNNVSPQMYIREARRMQGRYMLNQNDLTLYRHKPDTICMGSYNIDSHDVAVYITEKGRVKDGYLIASVDPYEIPYRSITPYAPQNLLVTCAISATHIAYGSARMEPVFMMIGQAAGAAAHIARTDKTSVQDISIEKLQKYLTEEAKIPLQAPYRPVIKIKGPEKARVGERVSFTAEVLLQRKPVKLYWNFDGSGATQSESETLSFTPSVPKTYTVSLRAIDEDGRSSLIAMQPLQVGDPKDAIQDVSVKVESEGITLVGRWDRGATASEENRGRINYHDLNSGTNTGSDRAVKTATFTATLPKTGRYIVAMAFQDGANRASNTPVTIHYAGGSETITLNQKKRDTRFAFKPLGTYRFEAGKPASVIVSNKDANGYVSIDEIRWIYVGE